MKTNFKFYFIFILISLIVLEGLGWAIIFLREKYVIYNHPKKELYKSQNIVPSQFISELNYLYGKGLKFEENRWYGLKKNYFGMYHRLDDYGFRNDPVGGGG